MALPCQTVATVGGGSLFNGLFLQRLGVTRASDPPVPLCGLKLLCSFTSGTPEVCQLPAGMADKNKLVLYHPLYVSTKKTK